jgi:phage major head subunit gpT-like protein
MQITPVALQTAFIGYDTQYQAAFKKTPIYWPRFASHIPSVTRQQTHAFLDRVPQLRKWIGARQVENLKARSLAVTNEKFELTVSISRDEFEDDQYDIYGPSVQQMGESSRMWVDQQLILPAIQNGAAAASIAKSYDGVPFFSASHPVDASNPSFGSAQSNLFNSSTSGALPLTAVNYQTVRQTMMSYLGADGSPLNVIPDLLLVPPQLERTARTIVQADTIATTITEGAVSGASQQTNVLKGTADVLVWPSLSNEPTAWYLLCTNRALKPFVYQDRIAPEFAFLNAPTDPNVFLQDEYIYGVRARGAGAYGMWWLAAKASNT